MALSRKLALDAGQIDEITLGEALINPPTALPATATVPGERCS